MAKYTRFINDEQWKKIESLFRRHFMDPAKRRQVERFTQAISQRFYVLAQIKLLGRRRGVAQGLAQIFRRP